MPCAGMPVWIPTGSSGSAETTIRGDSTTPITETGEVIDTGHSSRNSTTAHSQQENTRGARLNASRASTTQPMATEPVTVIFTTAQNRFCTTRLTSCFRR